MSRRPHRSSCRCAVQRCSLDLGICSVDKSHFCQRIPGDERHPCCHCCKYGKPDPLSSHRKLRFYIGNCDQRVGTRNCFDFVDKLSSAMFEARNRSPSVELIISPSIGFQGHGTPKHIFHRGAQWLAEQLVQFNKVFGVIFSVKAPAVDFPQVGPILI